MTNEEALAILEDGILSEKTDTPENNEALDRAISALKSIDRITAERDAFMEDFKKRFKEQTEKRYGIYRCDICKHGGPFDEYLMGNVGHNCPKDCDGFSHWEWRGIE